MDEECKLIFLSFGFFPENITKSFRLEKRRFGNCLEKSSILILQNSSVKSSLTKWDSRSRGRRRLPAARFRRASRSSRKYAISTPSSGTFWNTESSKNFFQPISTRYPL